MKRLFDLTLSALGLLVSVPLWALIAISIKLEDGGPVFYGQERVGKGGRRFLLWKFRSMTPDTGQQCARQAEHNDKRITGIGRIIRARAMDEWPQLWNIFKGDMSFVGPRPLLAEEIEVHCPDQLVRIENIPGYEARHQVAPGLTGLAQIFAPRDLPRRQKFRLDLLYIKKQSFLIDLWFIALSFWITFNGKCGEPWIRRQPAGKTRHGLPAGALHARYGTRAFSRIRPATEYRSQ